MARWTSSEAVSRSTLPISLRYMRTGSPVSITVELSWRLERARLERFFAWFFGAERSTSLAARASARASRSALSSSLISSTSSSTISRFSSSPSISDAERSPAAASGRSPSPFIWTPFSRMASYTSESSSSSTSTSTRASWISSSVTDPLFFPFLTSISTILESLGEI